MVENKHLGIIMTIKNLDVQLRIRTIIFKPRSFKSMQK